MAQISVQLLWYSAIYYLALVLEEFFYNVGVPSWVSLLPSHYDKGNLSFRTFCHLKKMAIISNLVTLLIFGFVCIIF